MHVLSKGKFQYAQFLLIDFYGLFSQAGSIIDGGLGSIVPSSMLLWNDFNIMTGRRETSI